ncbi:hypothetical protein EPR50_G00158940 [Perca flavescens]|uniref:PET100 cytochrome c oxidase chaperone n=2 Tax=Perca flavescens TaxID=8167 RepID=A0A484CHJ9_PERFV|nr:hypothetical protein EPR50_G00158940 [Perca flavescens]
MATQTHASWLSSDWTFHKPGSNVKVFGDGRSLFHCCGPGIDVKMGVKIEVFRMMLYLSFPVTMFWISNQAEYFEEYIVKRKREIFPPDEGLHRKELEDFKERMRVRKEQRILKEISMESEN